MIDIALRTLRFNRSGLTLAKVSAAAVAIVAGCSGDDAKDLTNQPPVSCGDGTVLENNKCVVAPDASAGAGGGSSVGGAGGQPANGGSAGTLAGGGGGNAGQSDADAPDASDAAIDVPAEGAPGPEDDPCPTEPLFLNCSDSCGPRDDKECDLSTCDMADAMKVAHVGDAPVVYRTPSKPGVNQKCAQECASMGETAWATHLTLPVESGSTTDAANCLFAFRVSVAAPWKIMGGHNFYNVSDFCVGTQKTQDGCVAYLCDGPAHFEVATDDPNAPARNVVIERLPKPVTCP